MQKSELSEAHIMLVSYVWSYMLISGDRGEPGYPGRPSVPAGVERLEIGDRGDPGANGLPGFPGPRGDYSLDTQTDRHRFFFFF